AVHLVADKGWRLLPLYEYDTETSEWTHRNGQPVPPLSLTGFLDQTHPHHKTAPLEHLTHFLAETETILDQPIKPTNPSQTLPPRPPPTSPPTPNPSSSPQPTHPSPPTPSPPAPKPSDGSPSPTKHNQTRRRAVPGWSPAARAAGIRPSNAPTTLPIAMAKGI